MKPLSQHPKLGLRLTAYLVFAILPLQAANRIWNGAGANDNWSTGGAGGNWTNATLALTGDTPLFSGTLRRDNVNDLTGLTVTGIDFISTADGNHFRISGNLLVLGGNILTSASAGTIQDEIALDMQLNGNRTITTASGHHILVSGVISQDATNRALTKLGPGMLLLSGANNYAGGTNIDSGTLRLMASSVIPDTGTVSVQRATNAGSTHGVLDLNGFDEGISSLILGSLTTTAANAGQTVSVISSSGSADLTLLGTGGITYRTGSSGFENGQALISTGIILPGDRTITVGDVPGLDEELVISGVVSQTGGNRNLTKNGLGTLRLSSHLNSFAGQMRINAGILSIAHLADSGAGNTSPIGTGSTTASIRLGSENNTGTLHYNGTGHSTNRPITLGNGEGAGGGTILSSGTGPISFTAATFITTLNSLDSRTLTLGGSNTAANLISGLIRDNGGALGTVNLAKAGSGTWRLNGANTFTGNVVVSSGRLTLGHPHALGFGGSALTAGITSVAPGAVLDLNGQATVLERIAIQGEGSGQGALVSDSGSATLASGIAAVEVNSSGTYSTPPDVDFTGGGGTGAVATAQLGLTQASLEISSGGSGYTSSPVVNISGGGGSGATATATLTAGVVTSITLTHPGTGYTSAPTIGFSGGGGTGATAVANAAQFQLIGITITNPGSGYTSAPTVTFSHGDSTAAAIISGVHLEADASIGGAGHLEISTPITSVAGASLTKRGAGTVTLTAPSEHDGITTVVAGTLTLSSSTANNLLPDSPELDIRAGAILDVSSLGTSPALHLSSNQTLKGTGTITGKTVIPSSATLAPGDGPGILSTGEVEMESGGVLSITLNGTTPGTGHSQLSVTGTVTLTGATLTLTGTHTPIDGQSFVIISNDGVDAVVGTFAGLPEGTLIPDFLGSSLGASITYSGGDGNDVVLTAVDNSPPTDITLTPSSIAENNAVGAVVGTLAAVDADVADTHTFTLVAGTGSMDNGSFEIDGDDLKLNAVTDFETQSSYSIRVQADDGNGGVFAKELTVTVTDVNDAPVLTGGPVELSPIYDHEATNVISILSILADASVDYQDEDSGALAGVAVVAASGAGVWQYSATGAVWANVGTVSDTAALLLPESYLLRYTPAYPGPDGGETAALTLRGWDLTGGTAGSAGTKVNATVQGGTAPFSLGTVSLRVEVLEDDRLPTVADVEVNEASPYAVFEVGGASEQLLTLALGNDADPATADATITAFTLETLNLLGTAWVAYTPGSQVAVPAGGTLLVRVSTVSEQDEVFEGVEFYTLVAAALSGASHVGLGSIRDDDEGAIFLASNLTATPNDPDDADYPVLDDDVVKFIQWGEAGSLADDSRMDATLPTVDATYPLFFVGMGAGLFDVSMSASGMVGSGLKRIGGQPAWSLTASSGGARALVNFRFFKAGSTTELKHLKNIVFRIEDAEAGEELSGFSYWDGHGQKVPVLWNNTAIFSYSHTPRFSSSNTVVENGAPLASLTQAGKWIQVDLRGLQVTGIEFSHRKRTSTAGSVVITHLAGQLAPDALDFGGTFSPLQVKANAANMATVPDYRAQATWTGGVPATVNQTPAPGTPLPLGGHEITLTLDAGGGVDAVQGFDLLVIAPRPPVLVVTTPSTRTTSLSGLSTYKVSGTVRDVEGVGISQVEVQHNGTLLSALPGAPNGTGTSAWSLDIEPIEGVNFLEITAEDSEGIRSVTMTRTFTFTRRYQLELTAETVQGSIAIKAATARSTTLLKTVGATKTYTVVPATPLTLTATTKTGHIFSHWSGLPGTAQSIGNVATLSMPSDDATAISAHFVSNPFIAPLGASNSFQGLLRPADALDHASDTVGMISGTLVPTSGAFSGRLTVAGLTHSFAATFQGDGTSVFTLNRTTRAPTLTLPTGHTLSLSFTGGEIQASLVKAAITSTGSLQRGIYSVAAKVPQALLNRKTSATLVLNNQGFYTAALPAKIQSPPRALSSYPQGDGYTTLTLRDNGTFILSGVLADGSSVTASSLLVADDEAPLFVQLNTPGSTTLKGASLSGTLSLQPGSASDVTGADLLWLRPSVTQISGTTASAKATQLYTAGWPSGITLDLIGAQYDTTLPVQTSLDLPAPNTITGNAQLDFSEGGLSAAIAVTDFYITGSTAVKIPATNKTFTLVISGPKATFSGTFTPNWSNAVTTRPAFRGILLQKGSEGPGGYGFFHSNRASDLDPTAGRATLGTPQP